MKRIFQERCYKNHSNYFKFWNNTKSRFPCEESLKHFVLHLIKQKLVQNVWLYLTRLLSFTSNQVDDETEHLLNTLITQSAHRLR